MTPEFTGLSRTNILKGVVPLHNPWDNFPFGFVNKMFMTALETKFL